MRNKILALEAREISFIPSLYWCSAPIKFFTKVYKLSRWLPLLVIVKKNSNLKFWIVSRKIFFEIQIAAVMTNQSPARLLPVLLKEWLFSAF